MAYLRPLHSICHNSWCNKRATVELIDRWNGTRGSYCKTCGSAALKRQLENETPQAPAPSNA